MPELWELCNSKSRAVLGYLYKQEYGHYPDWDERSGKTLKRPKQVYEIPVDTDMSEEETARFMQQSPSHQRRVE